MTKGNVWKFSPLDNSRIEEIIERSKGKYIARWLAPVARKAKELLETPQYSHLRDVRGEGLTLAALNANLVEIGGFLQDCRLIGAENEKNESIGAGEYVIGAEGVSLINEYMATKPNNLDAHEVKVVRNIDFADEKESHKTANVMAHQKGVHSGLGQQLTQDLLAAKESGEEFNKTYLIETFGSTGGNHFLAVTVRKNPDENSPLIDFFDPSPGLLRGNIETFQNSIAVGFAGQIMVNATLTQVLQDVGLEFDQNKYFTNLEPFQMRGSANCSVFSYEKAYMTANLSREEHEALLREHYKFDSPFGGKSEIDVNLPAVSASESGSVENPQLNLPAQYMAMTHFNSNAAKYLEGMEQIVHERKKDRADIRSYQNSQSLNGIAEEESAKERRDRYLAKHEKEVKDKDTQETKIETSFTNELITQKSFRQKYGHLFEIVTHPKFSELAELFPEQKLPSDDLFKTSAYFPAYTASEKPAEYEVSNKEKDFIANLILNGSKVGKGEKVQGHEIKGLNNILPFPSKVVAMRYNEETNDCEALIYGSERLGARLQSWARENDFGVELQNENFQEQGFKFNGLNEILQNRTKIILRIPANGESISKISNTAEKIFLATTPFTSLESKSSAKVLPKTKEQERK